MSAFQRLFPVALGAACLFGLGCGDDATASNPEDGDDAGFDSSVNPIEGDGDGDGDGDVEDEDASALPHEDAGVADSGSSKPDASTKPPPKPDASTPTPDASTPGTGKGTPVFVAVGYAGRRVRSTDLGLTWTDEEFLDPQKRGQDDQYLLRAVTFAKGVFVAVGWKIVTSEDGGKGTWTDHTIPGQQWLGGVQYGNNKFVATGGYGWAATSTDGVSWNQADGDLNTQASRSLAFGDGKFMSATDQGNWWTSQDGESWTIASGGHDTQIAYCGSFKNNSDCSGTFSARNRAVGEGVTIRANNGKLERSTNGVNFTPVLTSGMALEAVAFGYVE